MANFTADARSFEYHYCSTELAQGRNNELMVLLALNLFASVTASLGNALILAALHKESSLHPPSKLLFRNLATTDLAVGIISGPTYVVYLTSVLNGKWNICRIAFVICHITSYIFCGVSVLTMTAISVDRLLALVLGLKYRQVVTLKRIYVTFIVFWVASIICSTMYLRTHHITIWFGYSVTSLCLVTSVICYAKIFFTFRHNQVQAHGKQNQNVLPNRAQYKKTVNSALWVQVALLVCYLPYVITHIVNVALRAGDPSSSVSIARVFASTLVLLNSSLNPILCCWKIRKVRQAVKDVVKGLFCSSS